MKEAEKERAEYRHPVAPEGILPPVPVEEEREIYQHLLRAEEFFAEGNYEDALKENLKVLSLSGKNMPVDKALFNMGLIYAHYGNSKRDYKTSLEFFRRLIKDYPESSLIEQAKIWAGVLEANERLTAGMNEKRALQDYLLHINKLLSQGDYKGALKKNQKVLSLSGKNIPMDETLFNLGLIYADYRNPEKDFRKTIGFLEKILKDYPESPLIEQVKIWLGVLRVIEKSKQVDIEVEEMKKKMSR